MDDRAFDRAMRMLAARERPPEAGARLAQVLSSLPDAPAPRRRMGRRLVPALAAAAADLRHGDSGAAGAFVLLGNKPVPAVSQPRARPADAQRAAS